MKINEQFQMVANSVPADLGGSNASSSSTIKIRNLAHLLQQLDELGGVGGGGSSATGSAPGGLSTTVGTTTDSSDLYSTGTGVGAQPPSVTTQRQPAPSTKSGFIDLDYYMGTNLQGFAKQTSRMIPGISSTGSSACRYVLSVKKIAFY